MFGRLVAVAISSGIFAEFPVIALTHLHRRRFKAVDFDVGTMQWHHQLRRCFARELHWKILSRWLQGRHGRTMHEQSLEVLHNRSLIVNHNDLRIKSMILIVGDAVGGSCQEGFATA